MNNSDDSKKEMGARSNGSANPSNRKTTSCTSDPVMKIGRDAMNLAELPLAGLSSRSPKGVTSLVFEDRVWDKSQGAWVKKKLTVTAPAKYGLPTALDDEVILGLVQLAYTHDFKDRQIAFLPADVFRVLGWRGEGRDYLRLERSLNRWMTVTLFYDNAWWDAELQEWMDDRFQILERFIHPHRKRQKGTKSGRLPWTIIWSETVFKVSFRQACNF